MSEHDPDRNGPRPAAIYPLPPPRQRPRTAEAWLQTLSRQLGATRTELKKEMATTQAAVGRVHTEMAGLRGDVGQLCQRLDRHDSDIRELKKKDSELDAAVTATGEHQKINFAVTETEKQLAAQVQQERSEHAKQLREYRMWLVRLIVSGIVLGAIAAVYRVLAG